jgi:hypothetical protein
MDLEAEREAFECWCWYSRRTRNLVRNSGDGYRYALAQGLWEAWLARAALSAGHKLNDQAGGSDAQSRQD